MTRSVCITKMTSASDDDPPVHVHVHVHVPTVVRLVKVEKTTQRPNVDLTGIHRDLARYYTAYGMFDSGSTPDKFFERVVWPNMGPAAAAAAAAAAATKPPPSARRMQRQQQ